MNRSPDSSISPKGLRLQAKLTLAFVLVSLVGFVVAFQMLPRLILRSWTEEFKSAKVPNLKTILTFYAGLGPGEVVRELARRIADSEDFDLRNVELPQEGVDIDTFIRLLGEKKEIPSNSDLLAILNVLKDRFKIIRILPYSVPDLTQGMRVLVNHYSGGAYYLPVIAPLVSEKQGFDGTLVAGGYGTDGGTFDPYEISADLSGVALRLVSAEDVGYIPAETIQETDPPFYEDMTGNREEDFWEFEGVRRDLVLQLFPLFDIERDASGNQTLLGVFSITYKRPAGVFAWTELMSSEGYFAIAVAAVFALVFSYIYAKGITRPIQELTSSATAFAEGRLDEPVVAKSQDEIGILASTFNGMRQRLQTTLKQLQERAETIQSQKEELDEQFKSLQILQNYTENVLASVDSAIFSIDTKGEVRSHNRAAQELLGLQEGSRIEETLSESLSERLRSALEIGETTFSEEMNVESPNHEVVPVAVSVTPLREGERIIGAVAVLTDLSVIKNLEATVSRQQRLAALGQLTAGVAHEVRNPLSIIKACAEILQQNFQGQPGENGLCNDIIEEADRLSRVVTEFLTFARPNEPNRAAVDLNEVLGTIVDRIELTSPEEIRIERQFDPDLPEVEADADQMEQVLLNLMRNGIEAMGREGTMIVRSGRSLGEKQIWVEVQDDGMGMDEETRGRVFDPFYTSKAEGTGLGLSICHRILESHGGGIIVLDSKPGIGTTFRITLPINEREPVS